MAESVPSACIQYTQNSHTISCRAIDYHFSPLSYALTQRTHPSNGDAPSLATNNVNKQQVTTWKNSQAPHIANLDMMAVFGDRPRSILER